ncbi:MAG: hypothetical protein ISEC1_P1454 [Thiomicrorhabdus sp.]|nr:MAG: hypothetical protein ISEC1_P1454 [Thiomicrorhabdus sp.]
MQRNELVNYLNELLKIDEYNDYAPNGLQVEGCDEIKIIVTGVTACNELINEAIKLNAHAIIVHHGFFWKSEPQEIVGFKQKRIKNLLVNDINLLGYHLPLDGHSELGNNAELARLWQLKDITPDSGLVRLGHLSEPIKIDEFITRVTTTLGRKPLHLKGGPEFVKTVSWCSGGAQNYIDKAVKFGADVYISGEVSEQTMHLAKECGIHYLSAGHHATEKWGIKALGEHLSAKFKLQCHFVDIPNPV